MNTEREIKNALVKAQLPRYLAGRGIDIRRAFRCLNPQHTDKNPSMSYDRQHNRCSCFACNARYDIFDVVEVCERLDKGAAFKRAYEYAGETLPAIDGANKPLEKNAAGSDWRRATRRGFNTQGAKDIARNAGANAHTQAQQAQPTKPPIDFSPYRFNLMESQEAQAYLATRGFDLETAQAAGLGYSTKREAIMIPTDNGGAILRMIKANDKKGRYQYAQGYSVSTTGSAGLRVHGSAIFICEGFFDALSVMKAGFRAMSLNSVSNVDLLARQLAGCIVPCPVILALDNDDKGREGTARLKEILKGKARVVSELAIGAGCKDLNEWMMENALGFAIALENAEKKAMKSNIFSQTT